MARRCFFSFHYDADAARAAQVRQMGVIEGNRPTTDNHWEQVKQGGDAAIKRWIADQLAGRTCAVVLIGSQTAGRRWVTYEIIEAWNRGMGVVGIHIYGLKNLQGLTSYKGQNPLSHISYGNAGQTLASVAKTYDPPGFDSKQRYAWIRNNLVAAVEEAVSIRKQIG